MLIETIKFLPVYKLKNLEKDMQSIYSIWKEGIHDNGPRDSRRT